MGGNRLPSVFCTPILFCFHVAKSNQRSLSLHLQASPPWDLASLFRQFRQLVRWKLCWPNRSSANASDALQLVRPLPPNHRDCSDKDSRSHCQGSWRLAGKRSRLLRAMHKSAQLHEHDKLICTCEAGGASCGHFRIFAPLASEALFFCVVSVALKDARRAA